MYVQYNQYNVALFAKCAIMGAGEHPFASRGWLREWFQAWRSLTSHDEQFDVGERMVKA
jgi:hypothetical protein